MRSIQDVRAAFDKDMQDWEASLQGEGLTRVRGMVTGQKNALIAKYGQDLNAYSHGEGFMKIFESRFTQKGVYILDEPEASLSPVRQLSFMSLVQEMVKHQQAQFIMATHSPILMAYPEARILQLSDQGIVETAYEDTEHYQVTRNFLANPARMLKVLFSRHDDGA